MSAERVVTASERGARVIRADRRGPAVVPAAVVDAQARAEALIATAERDARLLHERALADARLLHEHALADARLLHEHALADARAGARAEHARELLALTHAHEQALAALEPQVIAVALQAAKSVLGAEISAHPEQIAAVVSPLIARLRRARRLELRVHPDDCAALAASLEHARALGGPLPELQIEADARVTRGGCIARSEIGTLDAQVETQLDAFARALGVG